MKMVGSVEVPQEAFIAALTSDGAGAQTTKKSDDSRPEAPADVLVRRRHCSGVCSSPSSTRRSASSSSPSTARPRARSGWPWPSTTSVASSRRSWCRPGRTARVTTCADALVRGFHRRPDDGAGPVDVAAARGPGARRAGWAGRGRYRAAVRAPAILGRRGPGGDAHPRGVLLRVGGRPAAGCVPHGPARQPVGAVGDRGGRPDRPGGDHRDDLPAGLLAARPAPGRPGTASWTRCSGRAYRCSCGAGAAHGGDTARCRPCHCW